MAHEFLQVCNLFQKSWSMTCCHTSLFCLASCPLSKDFGSEMFLLYRYRNFFPNLFAKSEAF